MYIGLEDVAGNIIWFSHLYSSLSHTTRSKAFLKMIFISDCHQINTCIARKPVTEYSSTQWVNFLDNLMTRPSAGSPIPLSDNLDHIAFDVRVIGKPWHSHAMLWMPQGLLMRVSTYTAALYFIIHFHLSAWLDTRITQFETRKYLAIVMETPPTSKYNKIYVVGTVSVELIERVKEFTGTIYLGTIVLWMDTSLHLIMYWQSLLEFWGPQERGKAL